MTPARAPAAPQQAQGAASQADQRLLRQLRQLLGAVKNHSHAAKRLTGVGALQIWALGVIQAQEGIGVNEVAAALSVRQPTASAAVKGLVECGFVETVRNPTDRRQVRLRLLPPGREALLRAPGPFNGVVQDALSRLDAPTAARLEADLDTLLALIQPDPALADQPLAEI